MVNWLPFITSLLVNNILPHSTVVRYGVPDPPTTNLSAWPSDSNLKLEKIAKLEIYNSHMPSYARVTLKCPQKQTECSFEEVGLRIPDWKLMNAGYSAEKYAADVGPFLEDVGRWAGNMTDFEEMGVQPKDRVARHPDGWWYTVEIFIDEPWVPRLDFQDILPPPSIIAANRRIYEVRPLQVRVEAETSNLCLTQPCAEWKGLD